MEVKINESLLPILERIATGNNKTPAEMVEHFLEKILTREYKEQVKEKIEVANIEDVIEYETLIEAKRLELHPVKIKDPLK